MTEDDARAWIAARYGPEATDRVATFLDRVIAETEVQNLISPASISNIWVRHALDSAQLLELAPSDWSTWLDIGTGGGFPGMVIALLAPERAVTMVEPRAKRAAFLSSCTTELSLPYANVEQQKVQNVATTADVISARAVASVENLLRDAAHCAKQSTTWLLPRGRSATDLRSAQRMFHVEHSLTDAESVILVGNGRTR